MRVKSITYAGKSDVYNMEVMQTHSFSVEGGLIVHNCADEMRYFAMLNPIAPRKTTKPREMIHDPLDIQPQIIRPSFMQS